MTNDYPCRGTKILQVVIGRKQKSERLLVSMGGVLKKKANFTLKIFQKKLRGKESYEENS
jgi:hypothetical protein